MKTLEKAVEDLLADFVGKVTSCDALAKDSALQAIVGPSASRDKSEADAKRYLQEADIWKAAIRIAEYWTTGPGRDL